MTTAGIEPDTIEFAVFTISNLHCAVESTYIQEILNSQVIAPVPRAPDYISGVINLRGNIVTVLDLKKKLQLPEVVGQITKGLIVIVKYNGEFLGILVDDVSDIVREYRYLIEEPVAGILPFCDSFVMGIYKTEKELVAILQLDSVVKYEPSI